MSVEDDRNILERKIAKDLHAIYSSAWEDMKKESDRYWNGWDEEVDGEKIHHKGYFERLEEQEASGAYTEEQMNAYRKSQEARGEYWDTYRENMAYNLTRTNEMARDIVNGVTPELYKRASNETMQIVRKSAIDQGVTGIRFDMIDKKTLNAITKGKVKSAYHKQRINKKKDEEWNLEKLDNVIYEAILTGEHDFDAIGKKLENVCRMNENAAIRCARTAYTAAINAGKQDRLDDLSKQGVESTKIWVTKKDNRVRDAHDEADGQEVPSSEPFIVGGEELMYPGDASLGASGWNLYNCRCEEHTGRSFKFHSVLSDDARKKANIRIKG